MQLIPMTLNTPLFFTDHIEVVNILKEAKEKQAKLGKIAALKASRYSRLLYAKFSTEEK